MHKLDFLSPEILQDLYLNQFKTDSEIAKMYDTHQYAINRLRSKYKISTILKSDRNNLPPLSERQKEILTGSLLGDGRLIKTGEHTASFYESHCENQKGYLDWKSQEFEPFSLETKPTIKRDGDKEFKGFYFSTKANREMKPWHDKWYPNDIKAFPKDLILTPLSLAVWYLDDGNISRNYPTITFGLDSLSLSNCIKALRKIGLKPTIYEGDTLSIHFTGANGETLYSLIKPHIIDSMMYKIPVYTKRSLEEQRTRKLTIEKALELSDSGLTETDIAKLYQISKATVSRRLTGISKKRGRPFKNKYGIKASTALIDSIENHTVETVYTILQNTQFPINDPKDYIIKEQIESVINSKIHNFESMSPAGSRFCKSFMPHIYQTKNYSSQVSAYEAWHTEKHLKDAIKFQLKYGDPCTPKRVLRAIEAHMRTPSNFRPVVARYLVDIYCPMNGTVLDPCAGWGGRLLGTACSLTASKYIGIDVEPSTVNGLQALWGTIEPYIERSFEVDLVCGKSEEILIKESVDLVLTSPPYYNAEIYSGHKDQSCNLYKSYDAWLEGFLRPMIEKSVSVLVSGGHILLNIADVKRDKVVYSLVRDAMDILSGCGLNPLETLQYPLQALGGSRKPEPILVFRKS